MRDATLIAAASTALPQESPCQTCGACCSYARDWPRFTTEDDSELERIPHPLVADNFSGMRCDGDRCSALSGKVGVATACSIYEVRPLVCRACEPGDEACSMARRRFGLSDLSIMTSPAMEPASI